MCRAKCMFFSGVSRGGPSRARPYLDIQNAHPAISAIVHVHSIGSRIFFTQKVKISS